MYLHDILVKFDSLKQKWNLGMWQPHRAIMHEGMLGSQTQAGGGGRLSLHSLGINLPLPDVITAKRSNGTTPQMPGINPGAY